jgi:hypothetical protein
MNLRYRSPIKTSNRRTPANLRCVLRNLFDGSVIQTLLSFVGPSLGASEGWSNLVEMNILVNLGAAF